jgi:hypothetical protein
MASRDEINRCFCNSIKRKERHFNFSMHDLGQISEMRQSKTLLPEGVSGFPPIFWRTGEALQGKASMAYKGQAFNRNEAACICANANADMTPGQHVPHH